MSTRAANGSGISSRSKKSSGAKHSSNPKPTSSNSPRSISIDAQELSSHSGSIARSSKSRQYTLPERIVNYTRDTEYSNTGYSPAYTNALAYTYGFPKELEARTEMEQEMTQESQERALEQINRYDRMMEYEQRRE